MDRCCGVSPYREAVAIFSFPSKIQISAERPEIDSRVGSGTVQ